MNTIAAACLLSLTAALSAQTQTLRGKVEDVQNTQNQFFLDCTNIPLVSTALNLNAWVGQQAILQVVNVGTAQAPVLRVDAATATAKVFDMGNLRLGQTHRWQVDAPAGSFAFMFLDFTANTTYTPFGQYGTWLLGPGAATLASGVTNAQNQFEINFTMPSIPGLLGTSMTGQALVNTQGNWFFANPDCKTIQQ
ncbi:MAG: hypothetical protein H6838_00435 [Planctomycetes bacterium]|nr:hypothetical protein [Planctomycetota bacterium]MCB9883921.1 hypothetical protein [Planctomycetota bacterium]